MPPRPRTLALAVALVAACGDRGRPASAPPAPLTPDSAFARPGAFTKAAVRVRGATYAYQFFVPRAYDASRRWPVVLFIHGSGQRGADGDRQRRYCMGPAVEARAADFPAIVVFPQVPAGEGGDRAVRFEIIDAALDSVAHRLATDSTRYYVTGFSMGGGMAYEMAYRHPDRFAALVPVSAIIYDPGILGVASAPIGSGYEQAAESLRAVPTWIFHNADDGMIDVAYPRRIVAALRTAGATDVRYTEGRTGGHDCGDVYARRDLYDWMFARHR